MLTKTHTICTIDLKNRYPSRKKPYWYTPPKLNGWNKMETPQVSGSMLDFWGVFFPTTPKYQFNHFFPTQNWRSNPLKAPAPNFQRKMTFTPLNSTETWIRAAPWFQSPISSSGATTSGTPSWANVDFQLPQWWTKMGKMPYVEKGGYNWSELSKVGVFNFTCLCFFFFWGCFKWEGMGWIQEHLKEPFQSFYHDELENFQQLLRLRCEVFFEDQFCEQFQRMIGVFTLSPVIVGSM